MGPLYHKGLRKLFKNNVAYSDLLFLNCEVLIHQKYLGFLVTNQKVVYTKNLWIIVLNLKIDI